MNPLLVEALGSIIRWGLAVVAGYLVEHGVWTSANAQIYIGAASLAIVSLLWSIWQKYGMRVKFVTAAASAGLSEHEVETMVKDPTVVNPPVSSPKADVPVATTVKDE